MSAAQILTLSCRDRPGITAKVTGFLFDCGANVLEAQQFNDSTSGDFFMRVAYDPGEAQVQALCSDFGQVADDFGMDWNLRDRGTPRKVLIMVSKFDHCLADLLYRHRIGELPMEIAGIVCNHPHDALQHVDLRDIPFHHLPVSKETKPEQEARVRAIVEDTGTELVVLARYMQVLSDGMAAWLSGRCINIHHSFLPSFIGANPYLRAYERGVKLIGATCHYVTEDLDEGPIIEQDVIRVNHSCDKDDLVRLGRDVEQSVLSRGLRYHLEDRVVVRGNKTVVFTS